MARKKKPLPLIEGLEITAVAAEGKSIARIDGELVVFIPYGAPGDIADVKIDRRKHSFAEGHIVRLVKPSELRIAPRCSHFGTCGGCRWQHLPYDYQLKCKQQQVEDALTRIAKVELPQISPILGSENVWLYRNKMEYTFSNRKWVTFEQLAADPDAPRADAAGFHIPGAFDKVLDIECCYLQEDFSNRVRLFVREFAKANGMTFYDLRNHTGLLRTMMVRTASTGQKMVMIAFGEDSPAEIRKVMEAVASEFPEITSLLYTVNTKVNDTFADLDIVTFAGSPFINEEMENLTFRVGPKSFYQTNSNQALRLYSVVRDFAALSGSELVYDLYTGTGTIACFLARNAARVIGVEYVPEAIEDAKVNATINRLDNTEFFAGDMKEVLTRDFVAEHGVPDVMVVDPPRAGMHPDVVNVILEAAPRRIVYVSCNPATQARDLALLDSSYKVVAVQPVDMFPHTHHVENVILLEYREK